MAASTSRTGASEAVATGASFTLAAGRAGGGGAPAGFGAGSRSSFFDSPYLSLRALSTRRVTAFNVSWTPIPVVATAS